MMETDGSEDINPFMEPRFVHGREHFVQEVAGLSEPVGEDGALDSVLSNNSIRVLRSDAHMTSVMLHAAKQL